MIKPSKDVAGSSIGSTGLTKDQFQRRFRAGLIAAWLIPPATGEFGMTFLGFWELGEAGLSLIRFTGIYVIAFTLGAFFVLQRVVIEPVLALGEHPHTADLPSIRRLRAFPWVFWALLGLYAGFGPATVLLSNTVFQGTEYTLGQYAFSAFAVIPFLLIAASPLFFYLTDLLGRYLGPRNIMVMVAPLWLKVTVLGLFTPIMIDTVLLTYYFNRTGFLRVETIMLWLVLLLIAGVGTYIALLSFQQGIRVLKRPLGDVHEAGDPTYPVPHSLDEFGLLARGWADLLEARKHAELEVRLRDRRIRDIIDNTDAVIYIKDTAGRYLMVNRRFEQLLGISNYDAVGKTDRDILPKEIAAPFHDDDRNVVRSEKQSETQVVVPHADGPRTYIAQKFPLYDAERLLYGSCGIATDITERMQADEKLQHSEARLSGIIQIANDAIITVNRSQRIILFNQGAERVFGYSSDELLGRALDVLLPERFRKVHRENIKRFGKEEGQARPMHERSVSLFGRRKSGEEFPLEASISRLDLGGEKIFTVALRDITERRRAEEALWETQTRHEEAQRLAHLGHWTLDLADNSLVWSTEIYRIFEMDPGEFGATYEAFLEAVHPDDRAAVDNAYTDSVQNRTTYDIVHRLRMGDGRIKHVQERCQTMYDEEGNALRSIGTVQDVTARKRAEEALRDAYDDLEYKVAERTAELAAANERLKELDRLKSMFIASMSHELRTPLNSIIGFTGVILRGMAGDITDTQKDQLTRVNNAGKHLLALISDVIDISKIEADKIEAYPESFALDGLVHEALDTVRAEMEKKGLDLELSVAPGLEVRTDRKRLLQCLLNYLSNAVKFTPGGKISLAARVIGDTLQVTVGDTGIGISEEDQTKLFRPFQRLESPLESKTPGTGLGLYLTRKLVTGVLGGSVSVQSRPGQGSTFGLRMPLSLGVASSRHLASEPGGDP